MCRSVINTGNTSPIYFIGPLLDYLGNVWIFYGFVQEVIYIYVFFLS